jgi:extracellular matrix regulatory protein A
LRRVDRFGFSRRGGIWALLDDPPGAGFFTRLGGKMDQILLNIGFGSTVVSDRIVAIVSPNSAPMKRLKDEARDEKRLIDATHGRRTRSIIITDSNHIILSAIQAETVSQRYEALRDGKKTEHE